MLIVVRVAGLYIANHNKPFTTLVHGIRIDISTHPALEAYRVIFVNALKGSTEPLAVTVVFYFYWVRQWRALDVYSVGTKGRGGGGYSGNLAPP